MTSGRRIGASRLLAILVLGLATCLASATRAGPMDIGQFRHSTWSGSEVPGAILDIAHGPDGLIWLATTQGLVRFDGDRFLAFSAPETRSEFTRGVAKILIRRNGEIWVGRHGNGGVATFRNGVFIDRHLPNPERQITELEEGADGSVWTVIARPMDPVARWTGGRWQTYGTAQGLPEGWVYDLKIDGRGAVWAATEHHVAVLRPGAKRFEVVLADVAGGPGLARDAAGRMWLGDENGVRRLPDVGSVSSANERPRLFGTPAGRRVRLAFAEDGALWGAIDGDGVYRLDVGTGEVSRFTQDDGLAGDDAKAVLVDREGVVWVGGQFGLDAFVETLLVTDDRIPRPKGVARMASDGQGGGYVLNDDQLYHLAAGEAPNLLRTGLSGTATVCEGEEGVWLLYDRSLERIVGSRTVERFNLEEPNDACCCVEDSDGLLWAISEGRLLIREDRRWREVQGTTADARPRGLYRDKDGHAVLTDWEGAVHRPFDGKTWRGDQLRLGAISAVADGSIGLLVSGLDGLARLTPTGVQRLSARRHPWLTNLRGIAQTPSGDFWLFGDSQVARVSSDALDQAFEAPERSIRHTLFDRYDGLDMAMGRSIGTKVVASSDGELWILGQRGVMRLRPALLHQPSRPPPVQIEAVTAPGRPRLAGARIVFPPGVDRLQIDYVAGSLRTISRVRYRYRLEGVDRDWVDAGARRFAVYGRLPPGEYRFRVIAANDDGIWNTQGAAVAFRVQPYFWQTPWFLAVCALAGFLCLWLLYRLRIYAASARVQMVMEERLRERERIARDLHDTLLQGVQALILKFQLAANELPHTASARVEIEQALDRADGVLREARGRVLDLRIAGDSLASSLRRGLAEADTPGSGLKTTLSIFGNAQRVVPAAADEIAAIALEAVSNAYAHSQASQVQVGLRLTLWSCVLTVEDDGRGIPPAILAAGGSAGHFGLSGMRERATRLGGALSVESGDNGTRLTIGVPGRIAFGAGVADRFLSWIRRGRPRG